LENLVQELLNIRAVWYKRRSQKRKIFKNRVKTVSWKMKKAGKNGFTLVEIMFVVSIIGLLAALGIPSILKAYANAQAKVMDSNIAAVEKAKGILTLPSDIGMVGAMGLTTKDDFDESVVSNLCAALKIDDLSKLKVGNRSIEAGTLTLKAYYE
jgi:prepilin-type N-terminal cleavage/methylation domain-containing protein